MGLSDYIETVENCSDLDSLEQSLQLAINNYGFASYCFVDIGKQYDQVFHYHGTVGEAWEQEYLSNEFFHVDEAIKLARRSNTPFNWGSVPLPERLGRKKPGSHRLFDAALDHHFQEGLVVPLHYVDELGRMASALCTLYWYDKTKDFKKVTKEMIRELHLLLIYWMQKSIELRGRKKQPNVVNLRQARVAAHGCHLTDREREIIAWAGRGKTVSETAEILSISPETITSYVKEAVRKLGAGNKTHAVAKAIHLGLIDV